MSDAYSQDPELQALSESWARQRAQEQIAAGDIQRARLEGLDPTEHEWRFNQALSARERIENMQNNRVAQINNQIRQQQHVEHTAGLSDVGLEHANVCGLSPQEYAANLQRWYQDPRRGQR